jgi:hypothetical protein
MQQIHHSLVILLRGKLCRGLPPAAPLCERARWTQRDGERQ